MVVPSWWHVADLDAHMQRIWFNFFLRFQGVKFLFVGSVCVVMFIVARVEKFKLVHGNNIGNLI